MFSYINLFCFSCLCSISNSSNYFINLIYYISKYNSTDRNVGYNLKAGGNGGGTNSESTKKKIGITTKEKWVNPEIAEKMLNGLRKGTETVKKQALVNFRKSVCKHCGKEFTYRHMDMNSHRFCSKECLSLFRKNKCWNRVCWSSYFRRSPAESIYCAS